MTSSQIQSTRDWKRTLRNSTLLLGSTMTVMAGATISPALPAIRTEFASVPNAELLTQLSLTIPALFIALFAPFAGALLDRLGRRPVLIGALLLYGLAGASGFVLNSLYAILVGRALLGVAVAAIMSGFSTLIADYFSGDEFNRFVGLQAAFTGFGGVVFLQMGGLLADVGWRYPFLIYLLALLVLVLVVLFITEPEYQAGDTDGTKATMPYQQIVPIYLVAFAGMVLFYLVPTQLPFFLETLGVVGASVGTAIAAMTLAAALVSLQFQRIRARLSANLVFALTFGFMAIGYLTISQSAQYGMVIVGLLVAGVGLGMLQPNLAGWLAPLIPASLRGQAFGLLTMSLFLGQFISPVFFQPFNGNSAFLVGAVVLGLTATIFVIRTGASTHERSME
ncbi:MAG: MFS transporter [Chloroflexota bacterium]